MDGHDQCVHLGLIHGSMDPCPGWVWVTAANSVLVCSSNVSMDFLVTFGFVVACTKVLMALMMENGLNRINFEVNGLG